MIFEIYETNKQRVPNITKLSVSERKQQSIDCVRALQNGDKTAFTLFVVLNYGMLIQFVQKYSKYNRNGSCDDELVEMVILEKTFWHLLHFDTTSSNAISTYLYASILKNRTITLHDIPVTQVSCNLRVISILQNIHAKFLECKDKDMSYAESIAYISKALKMSEKKVENYLQLSDQLSVKYGYNDAVNSNQNGAELTLADVLADTSNNFEQPDNCAQSDICDIVVADCLNRFGERNTDIFKRYVGIGYEPQKYDEIGQYYGLTKQRIEQIYKRVKAYVHMLLTHKYKDW